MEEHNKRPFREGWKIAPEMEGSIEDEHFTDCEALIEAWDELVNRAASAGGRVGALLDSGKVMAALDEIHDAATSQMGELREKLETNTSADRALGEAIELLEDYREELNQGQKYLATDEERKARQARLAEIGDSLERLTTIRNGGEPTGSGEGRQGPPCPECSHPMKLLGESCEEAEQKMGVEDYYEDGSRYAPVGAHNTGVCCPECGYCEAEPCIHD